MTQERTYRVALTYGGVDYEDTVVATSKEDALEEAAQAIAWMLRRHGQVRLVEEPVNDESVVAR